MAVWTTSLLSTASYATHLHPLPAMLNSSKVANGESEPCEQGDKTTLLAFSPRVARYGADVPSVATALSRATLTNRLALPSSHHHNATFPAVLVTPPSSPRLSDA
jgi:hypothetical protein